MRRLAAQNKPRTSRLKAFPSPTAGWISNQNIAAPASSAGACVLENIFPTAEYGIIRRGSDLYATLGAGELPCTALFTYNFGNIKKFFAANSNVIYDITTIAQAKNIFIQGDDNEYLTDGDGNYLGQASTSGLEVVTGMTSGEWIDHQFATTGGNFLVIVNGSDPMQIFDGERFYRITSQDVIRLDYDAGTGAFAVGTVVTGGTSGASATIAQVVGTTASGFLILGDVTGGAFVDNEVLTAPGGGAAVADGTADIIYLGIDGIDTSRFSYVWSFKNRLFFIERDSFNVWYLPVDQIGGTAKLFPMGAEFSLGGRLMCGSTWSLDSGNGLRDNCIFVSDEGEVVVYDGTNPETAATWSKAGRYQMGKPRGPRSFFRGGGDIITATDIGLVPLTQALQTDYAVLSAKAVSYPIETAWNEAIAKRPGGWDCIVWPERQMVVVCLPTVNEQPPEMWVVNARTGAWAKFTNWDGTCLEIFQGRLFYGSTLGRVVEANVTGLDQGTPYTAVYVPLFSDLNTPAALKIAEIVRCVTRGPRDVNMQLSIQEDYVVSLPAAPSALLDDAGGEWGDATWGESVWGTEASLQIQQEWDSCGGSGYALSPAVQVTSGSLVPLDTQVVRLEMTYDTADIIS